MKPSRLNLKSRPAYSLIFAIVYMVVILVVAAGTIENVSEKNEFSHDISANSQSKNSAQSAAKQGIALSGVKGIGLGYEPVTTNNVCTTAPGDGAHNATRNCLNVDPTGSENCLTALDGLPKKSFCRQYKVFAKAQENENDGSNGTYYLPIPNTGNAGPDDVCDVFDADLPKDHPCNWGKIRFGQGVNIPLFDESTGMLPNAISSFRLKLRTPCKNQGDFTATCLNSTGNEYLQENSPLTSDNGRYWMDEQDVEDSSPIEKDDSIILWQLVGEYGNGHREVLVVSDAKHFSINDGGIVRSRDGFTGEFNTEITESSINNASSTESYVILNTNSNTMDTQFGANSATAINPYNEIQNFLQSESLVKAFFQFNIVGLILEDDANTKGIPYLEWQVEVDATAPIASDKRIVLGEGYYKGLNNTYYYPVVEQRDATHEILSIFTFSN